ncbi:hypothetical protein F2P81_013148 [Scophthalmus maximus]|uniref:Uncharacterized protein n=1 Tax=Scophthalmus maximus TaxID=52904 RepID=A0A6A4SU28_SCOMX|nr:hypothetical protein F2P81_013148 [Scophthalmus maximus]
MLFRGREGLGFLKPACSEDSGPSHLTIKVYFFTGSESNICNGTLKRGPPAPSAFCWRNALFSFVLGGLSALPDFQTDRAVFCWTLQSCIVGAVVPSSFEATALISVPMKPSPSTFNDYRPVALTRIIMSRTVRCRCIGNNQRRLAIAADVEGGETEENVTVVLLRRCERQHPDKVLVPGYSPLNTPQENVTVVLLRRCKRRHPDRVVVPGYSPLNTPQENVTVVLLRRCERQHPDKVVVPGYSPLNTPQENVTVVLLRRCKRRHPDRGVVLGYSPLNTTQENVTVVLLRYCKRRQPDRGVVPGYSPLNTPQENVTVVLLR